jgi:hypothetical protein
MNHHTLRHPATAREAVERRFARGITAALDRSLLEPPTGVTERLRFAREAAVERARARHAVSAAGHPVALAAGGTAILGFARSAWWGRVASVLPVIALVAGLVLIVEQQQADQIAVAAQIDAELLGDDLPLKAYRDPGFLEFLKAPPGSE